MRVSKQQHNEQSDDIETLRVQLKLEKELLTEQTLVEATKALHYTSNNHDKFALACMYVKSSFPSYINKGIEYLRDLLTLKTQQEIEAEQKVYENLQPASSVISQQTQQVPVYSHLSSSSSNTPNSIYPEIEDPFFKNIQDYKRDCFYYIALGYYNLEDYTEARKWIENRIRLDSLIGANEQSLKLLQLIERKLKEVGTKGLAIAGAAAGVGAVGAVVGAGIAAGAVVVGTALLVSMLKRK